MLAIFRKPKPAATAERQPVKVGNVVPLGTSTATRFGRWHLGRVL